jgi:hypothetical protein
LVLTSNSRRVPKEGKLHLCQIAVVLTPSRFSNNSDTVPRCSPVYKALVTPLFVARCRRGHLWKLMTNLIRSALDRFRAADRAHGTVSTECKPSNSATDGKRRQYVNAKRPRRSAYSRGLPASPLPHVHPLRCEVRFDQCLCGCVNRCTTKIGKPSNSDCPLALYINFRFLKPAKRG